MAKLLIAGGAGYVGAHTAKALAAAGHECVVFDNLSTGHSEFVRWGRLVKGDIRDDAALDRVFADQKVDAVLHFAALAYVGESMTAPSDYYDVNVNGTRTLLDAMRRARVERVVFSSSCAVYGARSDQAITEDLPKAPINPYGFTKLACERMMDDYEAAYGLKSIRLRYFNAAGADPAGEIGEHHDPEPHLIPLVLEAAAGRNPSLAIYGDDYETPDGTAVRDYVHVADLAAAHVAAASALIEGQGSAALNLGTGEGASVRQIVAAAEAVTGRCVPTVVAPRRPGDPPSLVADATRARMLLDWTPLRSHLPTILGDAWAWHVKRFGSVHAAGAHSAEARGAAIAESGEPR